MIYRLYELIVAFLIIGVSAFGGGYAALGIIQGVVVNQHNWIDLTMFADMVTISQMTPGPIGINIATFVGVVHAGLLGGVIASIAFILPSIFICYLLGHIYLKYGDVNMIKVVLKSMRPVVVGLIFAAGISLLVSSFFGLEGFNMDTLNPLAVGLFILSMILINKFKKLSPILMMFIVGIINLIIVSIF